MKVSISELQLNEKYYIEPNNGINREKVIGTFKGDIFEGVAVSFKVKQIFPKIALYKGCIIFPKNSEIMFEKVAQLN
tara:strand:- start:717 stop:947 length:231 start_codon:yes stop_codon:yes gene_type:complete